MLPGVPARVHAVNLDDVVQLHGLAGGGDGLAQLVQQDEGGLVVHTELALQLGCRLAFHRMAARETAMTEVRKFSLRLASSLTLDQWESQSPGPGRNRANEGRLRCT
jgi:hypothetical protein